MNNFQALSGTFRKPPAGICTGAETAPPSIRMIWTVRSPNSTATIPSREVIIDSIRRCLGSLKIGLSFPMT